MNNYYDLFRRKTNSTKCSNNSKANLIMNAAGTTKVLHRRVNKDIDVNLVITNRTEGLGTAKIYTWVKDDLRVGDYFVWQGEYVFLVTEQENNVLLDKNIHKFSARECNVLVQYKSSKELDYLDCSFDAVFMGRGLVKANPFMKTREDNPLLLLDTKDMLIYSGDKLPRFASCMIRDKQWDVLEYDTTTAYPIIYCTIEEVPVTLVQVKEPEQEFVVEYKAGLTYEFVTEDYYYTCDINLKTNRQKEKVLITMPYNINTITFYTKESGQIIEHTIEIKE